MRPKRIIFAGLIVLVAAFLTVFADFRYRSQPTQDAIVLPPVAIIFTGQFDRIERGLDLMEAGEEQQLYISGVNPKAGLEAERFVDQFALNARQIDSLTQGQIVLATEAHTTLENAIDTACWLDTQPDVTDVTLITSRSHLARASLALERATGAVRVVRVASDPMSPQVSPWYNLVELRKFAATRIISALPARWWPANPRERCELY